MDALNSFLEAVNGVIWHDVVLYVVLGVGVLFTVWSGFCQYRALTHGVAVTRGKYDDPEDPGAINHFQALSAALSATVGLGNIGGVATAIALGGPGAVFWMWMIGLAGMALKTTEVALSMLYRNTDDRDEPYGGPMWVVKKGLEERGLGGLGSLIGGVFCVTLLISAITGGNMFQAWNVGAVTNDAFGINQVAVGIVLAVLVGMVIIGGIKRIGHVAGRLVPVMCILYLLAALYVIAVNIAEVPAIFGLIVSSAFNPADAKGAFLGGTFGYAFLWGMKRALFSSEAGQGSSPIAHSAAKTDEPIREAVVAGLEPFIDTLVVCTLTSLVILGSGAWNREHETALAQVPEFTKQTKPLEAGGTKVVWTLPDTPLPSRTRRAKEIASGSDWQVGRDQVFMIARWGEKQENTATDLHKVFGKLVRTENDSLVVKWDDVPEADVASGKPVLVGPEVWKEYAGATLTQHAFDRVQPGLGTWLVVIASWLFAVSTMISWSYYGEQGIVYLFGKPAILPYKLCYCLLIIVSCLGFITTDKELDNVTALGTGVMLWANIPIMLMFSAVAMRAYHKYMGKLKRGEFHPHGPRDLEDMMQE